jgi:hypothetical protein
MIPTSEQDIIRSLGRIEGRFEGVEKSLAEIHALTKRVSKLENKNSKLYGALTIIGLLWTTAAALLLKAFK